MLCAKSNRIAVITALAVLSALFAFGGINAARAQTEPPTAIPAGGPPPADPNAIPFETWLLYPSVNFLAENSANYFLAPQSKISGWELGVTPALTAIWSNGIHTTTLFGNFSRLQYPTDSLINQSNGEATWTQQYAPLRDLNFTVIGDYTHQTISSGLTSAIPSPTGFTGFIFLPNGNYESPNGTIYSGTTGQPIGQASPTVSSTPFSLVNPYDTFTGTARVQKLFSDGVVTLGASVQRQDYDLQGTPNFTTKTFSEDASFWLGSVFYAYSDGSFTMRTTDPDADSTAYRFVGGIGTRQFGLFRASAYFGHQGSGAAGSGSSGGSVYGGSLTYYPTPDWTISATVDDTINIAPANAVLSNQAIGTPGISPLQIPTSSSTQITSTGLHTSYTINQQWTANGTFAYTHVENIGSPLWDDSWVADASLTYNIWRNMTLSWEYQYSTIVTNQPDASAVRNLITMSATYKF
jgi:hypothetical protein